MTALPVEANFFDLAQRLFIATALGLLVGLERVRAGKEAGLRTFSLTAMAGCLSQMIGGPYYGLVTLLLTGVIIAVTNAQAIMRGAGAELTTSVALIVTCFSGILVGLGWLFTPVAATVFVLLLLAWKDEMVGFSQLLRREEIHAAITLLLLGLVILPILPRTTIDPWNLINPRTIWITVVLVSLIGFANYVLLRLYGARGVTYTGFLGGLVNSTATVAELAIHIRAGGDEITGVVFRGIMLAKVAMFLRNGVILGVLAPTALVAGILPVGLALAAAALMAWRGPGGVLRRGPELRPPEVKVASPFSMRAALEFGLYYLGLTVIGGVAQRVLGQLGFYVVSFFGGMVSSSSTTATAATLARGGEIAAYTAGMGVILSSIASALVLLPLVMRAARGRPVVRYVAWADVVVIGAALVGLALNPLFLSLWSRLV